MEAKALREIRDEEWHGTQMPSDAIMLIAAQPLHRRRLCGSTKMLGG